jgi:copper(I)-binding protein
MNVLLAAALIVLSNVTSHPAFSSAVVYATIHNNGTLADALDRVETPVGTASLHMSMRGTMNGMQTTSMMPVALIAVAAGGSMQLKPGGYHIMIDHLKHPLKAGESFPLRLHFRRAGWVSTVCTVVPY